MNFIEITKSWPDFKEVLSTKNLKVHYSVSDHSYKIFAVDGPLLYNTELARNLDIVKVSNPEEASEQLQDFESNFLPFANEKIGDAAQSDRAKLVAIVGREGSETVWATHNYCDATTWYDLSIRVSESLYNSGDNLTFSGSHINWIDMNHGKVLDEIGLKEDVEHGYQVAVTVDDIPVIQHDTFNGISGDYTVDYKSGSITFFEPVTGSVMATYNYATENTWILAPTPGRALDVEQAKINFTQDLVMTSQLGYTVYGYVDVFAPEYSSAYGGPIPSGTKIPIALSRYSSLTQIVDEAIKINPALPAMGDGLRGLAAPVYSAVFRYSTLRRLWHKYGMELHINVSGNVELEGTRATGTFYCVSRPEADLE